MPTTPPGSWRRRGRGWRRVRESRAGAFADTVRMRPRLPSPPWPTGTSATRARSRTSADTTPECSHSPTRSAGQVCSPPSTTSSGAPPTTGRHVPALPDRPKPGGLRPVGQPLRHLLVPGVGEPLPGPRARVPGDTRTARRGVRRAAIGRPGRLDLRGRPPGRGRSAPARRRRPVTGTAAPWPGRPARGVWRCGGRDPAPGRPWRGRRRGPAELAALTGTSAGTIVAGCARAAAADLRWPRAQRGRAEAPPPVADSRCCGRSEWWTSGRSWSSAPRPELSLSAPRAARRRRGAPARTRR